MGFEAQLDLTANNAAPGPHIVSVSIFEVNARGSVQWSECIHFDRTDTNGHWALDCTHHSGCCLIRLIELTLQIRLDSVLDLDCLCFCLLSFQKSICRGQNGTFKIHMGSRSVGKQFNPVRDSGSACCPEGEAASSLHLRTQSVMKRVRSRASWMHARARAQAYGQSSHNSDIAMQMESVLPANMLHFHNHGSSFQFFLN